MTRWSSLNALSYGVTYIASGEVGMERRSVTMRELQKMSASVIEALPYPVPITNGKAVIGLLSPVKRTDSEVIAKMVTEARAEFEQLSPEMQARIERFLADSGG